MHNIAKYISLLKYNCIQKENGVTTESNFNNHSFHILSNGLNRENYQITSNFVTLVTLIFINFITPCRITISFKFYIPTQFSVHIQYQ